MKTKFKSKLLSILLVLVMVLALVPVSALTAFAAGGTEFVHFAIKEHWGVCFEQTGSNNLYPITLTNENKLSAPLPTLYRTDYDGYIFDGWYIADTDTKVTQDTVFDGYTVVVDRWTFQEKDANTVISSIKVNNVALEAGMTTAEYNAAVQGATATVNGAPADAITADSAKTYTIYHGLNKSGEPLGAEDEVEVGKDYSVVTKIKLADGYTFSPNITFISDGGMCASERFLGGADIYTKQWNTLATEVEVTINFMNTDYYFDQTPESRNLENYAQYKNWYTVSKYDGLESVTLQYESGGEWAVFIDNVPFEANGEQAGGYVTVSPYVNTTKTFRLVANYALGTVYSEPFEISWACLNPVIESVAIGVTEPMNGFAPQYTVTTDSNRYILKSENAETVKNGIKWTGDVTGELAVSGSKFNNDNDYTVSIKLVAQDGYTFANDVTATINANNANVSVVSDTEIRISYTFPKPEKTKWYVTFSNPGGYASGNMQPVQVEEGEYTLPEPTYTPYSGYEFVGWSVNGELKQPGDVITVSDNEIIEARWQSTVNDSPKGFTKQPPSKNTNAQGTVAIAGIGYIPYSFADDLTIDPSISYEYISVEFYDAESSEWVTELDGVSVNYNAYVPTTINFNSNKAGTFTCRICAKKTVGGNMAISEPFTVTWVAKQFTTQPQGDMVVVGDTVTVTADKNFYVEKYEIEYNDGGVWKLYQEISGGWDAFSFDFTSDVAKSVTFRLKAYAEGDEYDEENDCWPIVLIDTSEEFTITWTSNEHVHTYGAIPNGKDETNHWKECTDPACPDKAHSKIEVEAHKDNTADNKCDVCGYDLPVPEYIVSYNENGGSGTMVGDMVEENGKFTLENCTYIAPEGYKFKAWAIGSVNGEQKQPGEQITITADTYIYAIWEVIPHECSGVLESGQGATCTVDGWKDYYRCGCGKYYEDANCQTPISDLEAWKVGAGKTTKDHEPNADDGDCTTAITCSVCGTVTTAANATHTAGADDGDCTTAVKCTKCDKNAIEAKATHTGGTATCTQKAECTICGKEYGNLANHIPNADDGDCTTAITCSVCGTVTTAANATHTAGADDGDCTTAVKCTKCDKNAVEANETHTGGTATCTQKAECTVCGKEYGNLANHIPNADDDCTTDITCSVCGEVTTEGADAHTGGTATCEHKAECTICGKEYGELAAHIPNADDGDCTTAITCSVCGDVTTEGANSHTGGTATCTQKAECTVCGKEYGSFGNHDYGTLIDAVAEKHTQTELVAGVAAHYQCSVCDTYFTSGKEATTLQALTGETPSHSYGAWQTNDDKHWKECSCGLKSEENDHVYDDATDVTCNTCDHDRTLPHTHGNGVKQDGQSATCTVDGWNDYYKCSCGKFYTEAACTNEITDLAAWKTGAGKIEASHNYGTLVSAVAQKHTQTELVAGVAAHYHCSACGKYFTEGKVETTLEALTGTTPSHSYGDWKTDADKHWKECSCGKKADEGNHVDANSNNKCDSCDKTLSGGVTPPPHTHDYGTTWKSDGTNHWKECSCGDKKEVTAHSGGTATCEAKAKCSECNTEYGELAEHKYSEATCTAKAKCSVCGDEKGELAAHTYVDGKCACGATDPNYVPPHEHNFVEGKCECGETDPNYQPPHEHNFIEGKCECGETDPNYTPGTDTPGTDVPGTDVPGTDKPEDPDDGLSGGAIAGIVAGSVVVLGGGGFALWWFVFRKRKLI